VSEFDVTIYEERTAHIPISILSRAVSKILDTATWFPTVAELLEACEAVRLEMRAALKFQPCDCEVCSNGWRITTTDGITNAWRCECWTAHQERVKALGVPEQPLALPAPEEFEAANE
jgi:hypothetical protein